jgi:hypothetical protein
MAHMIKTLLVVLAATALPLSAAQARSSQGVGVDIQGAGQEHHELDCEGGAAHIQGAGNRLTIVGRCSSLTIEGADNQVRVDLAPGAQVRVQGAGNRVSWTMGGNGRPRVSIQGADNSVQRGR